MSEGLAPEETLVHGRAKRATAGNRLAFLLQHLDDEDVRNDLLAEDDTDQLDYQLSDTEDVAFGSSDDDDDDDDDDDLTGEKELQKQERADARKKKRKAHDLGPLHKRQRVDAPNALLAPRPRKKSERISWLPTPDDAPTRQSMRRQTLANKEQTEAKLKESQKRSEKAHELLKIAAERKAARAGPALTQADRMQRALKVEKENSRSLNRWEKAEEERQLAQKRRLDALRDRQLQGPVIRYWSGSVIWEGDRIKVKRVHDKPNPTPEAAPAAPAPETPAADTKPEPPTTTAQPDAALRDGHQEAVSHNVAPSAKDAQPLPSETPNEAVSEQNAPFLDGIHYWASQSPEATTQKHSDPPTHSVESQPQSQPQSQSQPQAPQPAPLSQMQSPAQPAAFQSSAVQPPQPPPQTVPQHQFHQITFDSQPPTQPAAPPPPPPAPLLREQAQRSLVILEAFPQLDSSVLAAASKKSASASAAISSVLIPDALPNLSAHESKYLSSKSAKKKEFLPPPPPKPVCALTAHPARFRDPKTGIAYRDLDSYKALQKVVAGGMAWSSLLDCWTGLVGQGPMGRVAKGVPECFWMGKQDKPDEGHAADPAPALAEAS